MKILVTGANGFVGRHLCGHLLERGHEVTAAVRTPGTAPAGTFERVIGAIGVDPIDPSLVAGHETIVHLAARVHVMNDTSANPLAEFRGVNVEGTMALARAAAGEGVERFVFLSSIKVNGEATRGVPFRASDNPNPQDPYGVSKYEAELSLRALQAQNDLDVVIVRTPLVYGPQVGGNFIKTMGLARRGIPLPLASVHNSRTMSSVWNLVDLLEKCAFDPRAAGALVMAGDSFSPSTADLFRQLSAAMGKSSRLFPFPPALLKLAGLLSGKSAIVDRLVGSLEVHSGSSSTAWTWEPPYLFEDSIRRTAEWYMDGAA
jgi:nucleoside-diphosphate-sugar epimerase